MPKTRLLDYHDSCDWPIPFQAEDRLWGYLDRNGRVLIEPRYIKASCFLGEFARVEAREFGPAIYVRRDSTSVTPRDDVPGEMMGALSHGLIPFQTCRDTRAINGSRCSFGFLNKDGGNAIKPAFSQVGYFTDGLAFAGTPDSVGLGYIAPDGQLAIPMIYAAAQPFSEGLAAVSAQAKPLVFGFIDRHGKFKVPARYAAADGFHEGLAAVRNGTTWGYINTKGEEVIPITLEKAGRFRDGFAKVVVRGQVKYIDKNGDFSGPLSSALLAD